MGRIVKSLLPFAFLEFWGDWPEVCPFSDVTLSAPTVALLHPLGEPRQRRGAAPGATLEDIQFVWHPGDCARPRGGGQGERRQAVTACLWPCPAGLRAERVLSCSSVAGAGGCVCERVGLFWVTPYNDPERQVSYNLFRRGRERLQSEI